MQVQFTIHCSPFPCLIFLQLIISWELWYNQDFLSPHYHSLLQVTLYGPFSVINMTIKRNPFLAGATLISPLVLLSALPPASLLLPADDGSKLDIQINSMLAYAVYMMILSDYIPPFFNEQSPQLGECVDFHWILLLVRCGTVCYGQNFVFDAIFAKAVKLQNYCWNNCILPIFYFSFSSLKTYRDQSCGADLYSSCLKTDQLWWICTKQTCLQGKKDISA